MRKLQFKAWDLVLKRYTYFDLSTTLPIYSYEKEFVVQQFTGMVDSTGKLIFEGDILKIKSEGDWLDDEHFFYDAIVVFQGGSFRTKTQKAINEVPDGLGIELIHVANGAEIIGNVFEHDKLLKL